MGTAIEDDFAAQTEPFRRELLTHCYRMLGSVHDAEDLVQETLLRAWRAHDRFDDRRASLRTWLHRIATNACLTALDQRTRRPLPSGLGTAAETDPYAPLVRGDDVPWLQPLPDASPGAEDPVTVRYGLRLAFIAALQFLPPRQRAVLVLRDVLGWPAADVADALETTRAAVNSALQRARERLAEAGLDQEAVREPDVKAERDLVDRYVEAFTKADLDTLAGLLARDAVLEMPPVTLWYDDRDGYVAFIARVYELRGTDWRMVPVGANGQPAVVAYVRDSPDRPYELHTLQIFTIDELPDGERRITRTTVFQDPEVWATFALPLQLPA